MTTFKNGLESRVFYNRTLGFLLCVRNLLLNEAEGSEGLPNLQSLPFSEL